MNERVSEQMVHFESGLGSTPRRVQPGQPTTGNSVLTTGTDQAIQRGDGSGAGGAVAQPWLTAVP